MQKRRLALRAVHWLLLAACVVVALALARMFWWEAGEGRAARELQRGLGAQQQAQDFAPVGQPAASPPP